MGNSETHTDMRWLKSKLHLNMFKKVCQVCSILSAGRTTTAWFGRFLVGHILRSLAPPVCWRSAHSWSLINWTWTKACRSKVIQNITKNVYLIIYIFFSYHCKKCVDEKESGDMEGENIAQFDTKEEFYVHLLECGGDNDWRGERNKKKKGMKGNRNPLSQPKGNIMHILWSLALW